MKNILIKEEYYKRLKELSSEYGMNIIDLVDSAIIEFLEIEDNILQSELVKEYLN